MATMIRRSLLIFLIILGFSGSAFGSMNPLEKEGAATPSLPVSGIDTAIQKAQEEVRDPFAITPATQAAVKAAPVDSVGAPAAPEVTVVLEGIGFGSRAAYALIGGDIYYVGDEKNGIKLIEVRRREVDVLVNGGLITFSLFPKEEIQNVRERANKKRAFKKASAS